MLMFATMVDEMLVLAVALSILPTLGVSLPLEYVFLVMLAVLILSYALYRAGARAYRGKPALGVEGMLESEGVAVEPLKPRGKVRIGNELWLAESVDGTLQEGTRVKVIGVEGLTLRVRRAG